MHLTKSFMNVTHIKSYPSDTDLIFAARRLTINLKHTERAPPAHVSTLPSRALSLQ